MFDEEKQIIGYLINFYRKKAKISISTLISYKSEYIKVRCDECHKKCKQKEGIVSHKTIERMNKGVIIKNDCIYSDLVHKLGYKYELSMKYSFRIKELENQLLHLIRTKNKNGFLEMKEKLEMFSQRVNQLIYYHDIISIFLDIVDLELNHQFCDKKQIEIVEYLYKFSTNDLKKILIYYLARFYTRFPANEKCSCFLRECSKEYEQNVQILFVVKNRAMNKFAFIKYMEKYDTSSFMYEDYFFYYGSLSLGYMNLEDYHSALYYLDKAIAIAKQREMIDLYLIQCYMRRGVISYKMGKYKEALIYFRRVYEYDINVMMMNIILFFDCFKKIGKEEAVIALLKDGKQDMIKSSMVRSTYIYYRMKYIDRYPFKVLEDYVVNILKPHLRSGSDYEKIILNHLVEYTHQTHHFKKLHEFIMK